MHIFNIGVQSPDNKECYDGPAFIFSWGNHPPPSHHYTLLPGTTDDADDKFIAYANTQLVKATRSGRGGPEDPFEWSIHFHTIQTKEGVQEEAPNFEIRIHNKPLEERTDFYSDDKPPHDTITTIEYWKQPDMCADLIVTSSKGCNYDVYTRTNEHGYHTTYEIVDRKAPDDTCTIA